MKFPDEPIRFVPQDLGHGRVTVNPMHRPFGVDPGHLCVDCRFLVAHSTARTYLKCMNRPLTFGPGSDHRAGWIACGLFEANDAEHG